MTGRELCEAVRRLALRQFGLLAATVLGHWGVRSTSDIGDIVYNLIAAGDLEKTPSDSRSDFDNVFDFETALKPKVFPASHDLGARIGHEPAIRWYALRRGRDPVSGVGRGPGKLGHRVGIASRPAASASPPRPGLLPWPTPSRRKRRLAAQVNSGTFRS